MKRIAGWGVRLDRAIGTGRRAAFGYGTHDCLSFPALCIQALTGVDLFEPYRGRYSDEDGARALVPSHEALLDDLAAEHGWRADEACTARRGDLAAVRLGATFLCAVVYGGLIIPEAPSGLRRFGLLMAEKVWRIG
jgi:hypothetical protein